MRFENRFDVDAPLERVWDAVLDVERVAPTVPGAQVLERTGENAYKVAIRVKVGPMSMTYRGNVEVVESGKVATMGQGVLQDVSGRLVQTFARNLAEMLSRPDAGPPPPDQPPAEPAA